MKLDIQGTCRQLCVTALPATLLSVSLAYADTDTLLVDADVPAARTLCVLGDEVVDVPAAQCAARQHQERTRATALDAVLDQATIGVPITLLDVELLEAVTVGAQYGYEVGPSYRDEYFTRIDRYKVSANVQPGDVLGGLPVRVGIRAGSEIVFAQQFASGKVARDIMSTYTPEKLPLTSQRALALKPGDYVRFDAHLNLLATLQQLFLLPAQFVTAKLGAEVMASGMFQVHVFRLDAERVRIKLVAEREAGVSADVSGVPALPMALLGINQREQQLIELAKFDRSIQLALGKSDAQILLADYTVDLAADTARDAYDGLFHSARRLNIARLAGIGTDADGLRRYLVGNLTALDSLARTDAGIVQRNFKGAALASARNLRLSVALRTYDFRRERIYREKLISQATLNEDGTEATDYFLMPTWSRIRERSAFFGTLDERMQQSADALFAADADGTPREFVNLGFSFAYSDSILRAEEYRRLRTKIELLLPDAGELALRDRLADTDWLQETDHRGVRVNLDYFFRDVAFDALTSSGLDNVANMERKLKQFVLAKLKSEEYPYHTGGVAELTDQYRSTIRPRGAERRDPDAHAQRIIDVVWGNELRRTAKRLAKVLDTSQSNADRLRAFVDLRWSSFYRKLGASIWVYLMQDAGVDLTDAMFLELSLDAANRTHVKFRYGTDSQRDLFDAVRFIENVLNDRRIDMRDEGAVDSLVSRMRLVET